MCLCLCTEQGDDYLPVVNQRITFSEAARYVCFNTTIMNDGSCEALEFFTIKLSSSAPRVLAAPSTGYVIIRDPPLCSEQGVISILLRASLSSTHLKMTLYRTSNAPKIIICDNLA